MDHDTTETPAPEARAVAPYDEVLHLRAMAALRREMNEAEVFYCANGVCLGACECAR